MLNSTKAVTLGEINKLFAGYAFEEMLPMTVCVNKHRVMARHAFDIQMTYYACDPQLILKHLAAVSNKGVTIHPQHWCIDLYSKDPTIGNRQIVLHRVHTVH